MHQPWPRSGHVPELCMQNASDEFIYDVDMTLWPTKLGEPQLSAHREAIGPGDSQVSRLSVMMETIETLLKTSVSRL